MQLSWAPLPKRGALSVVVDGKTSFTYKVEGIEKMANGSQVTTGPAAILIYESKKDSRSSRMLLPMNTLGISDLFENESVEFSVGDLLQTARQSLAACFRKNRPGQVIVAVQWSSTGCRQTSRGAR